MSSLLVCPSLIGRERELARARAYLADAAGRGGVLVLSGEAGVGKSRLLSALLSTPEAASWATLRVACLESDLAEPYALVLELARVAVGVDDVHPTGLTEILPSVDAPDPERHVRRVQQALQERLKHVAGARPLLLVGEDLHWSDAASLSVLLGVIQRPERVALIASYRPEPLSPALAQFLAELNRLRLAEEIDLGPLDRVQASRMVQATLSLDGPLPGELLDEVMSATEGLPFLIEEVLRSLVENGALERSGNAWLRRPGVPLYVPRTLQQAIAARLSELDTGGSALAALAAVLGQVLDLDLLRRLSELDEQRQLEHLRALASAQILEAHPDGRLAFRHALTREAVLATLLEPERRALHRRVAEMLEAEPDTAPATLAAHWSRAGEPSRAASYALRAAERAAAVHAHREAIVHYQLALAGGAGPTADILAALGDHYRAVGEQTSAVLRYQQAQAMFASSGEHERCAELELRIGLAHATERERKQAQQHLSAAFSALPSGHPLRWQAGLHLALQLAGLGEYRRAEETLAEALRAAGQANHLARLRIGYELGGLLALRGEWPRLEQAASAVLEQVQGESDEALALRYDAHAALGSLGYYRGTMAAALEHFTACLRIAERRGLIADLALAHWNLATNALYHLGHWADTRTHLAELQALGNTLLATAAARFERWLDGRWEEAVEPWLDTWRAEMEPNGDLEVLAAFGRRIADILLALGRAEEALEFVRPPLARMRAAHACSFELQLAPREAESLARLNDPRAGPACEQGLELARRLGGQPAEALLLRARGLAHRSSGWWAEAFADLDAATALLHALPMPYEAARTQREAGLARLARGRRGDRERGAEYLRAAQRTFADLGAARDEAATSGILSAAGLAERAQRGPGPLSAREQEVAVLVAEGLSNQEIAQRLFITEKTAAYHVGSILNKLGFNSRSQIAAYVARLEPDPASPQR